MTEDTASPEAKEPGKEPAKKPKQISTLRKCIGVVALIIFMSLAVAFAHGVFRAFRIVSGSMRPTLLVGDCVLVDSRKPVRPKRGEVVALKEPGDPNEWVCKRVVALPGDKVEFRGSQLYVNGECQSEEYYSRGVRISFFGNYRRQLGPDEYFVLGDNQRRSRDSRDFGPVRRSDFVGTAKLIYWPLSRIQTLKSRANTQRQERGS